MPYLNGKLANTPLQILLPYGLTKQISFQTWLKQRNFFRPSALKYKVIYIKKYSSNQHQQGITNV